MKKLIAITLSLALAVSMAACGSSAPATTPAPTPAPTEQVTPTPEAKPDDKPAMGADLSEMPLQAILDQMLESSGFEGGMSYGSYPVSAEEAPFTIGYDAFAGSFTEALGYGPAIGSMAFVMVLFRLDNAQDADAFAADIKSGANPAKWVCVQAEKIETACAGNTVCFIMADTASVDTLIDAFTKVDPANYDPADAAQTAAEITEAPEQTAEPTPAPSQAPAADPTEPVVTIEPAPEPTPAPTEAPTTGAEQALEDILTQMISVSGFEAGKSFTSYPVSADDAPYVIGYDGFAGAFTQALGYGPQIGSIPFVMVLFRLDSGADAQSFAADIKSGANPGKWICVCADVVEAVASGNTVCFIMADADSVSSLTAAFTQVMG